VDAVLQAFAAQALEAAVVGEVVVADGGTPRYVEEPLSAGVGSG
jgi:hypothetical protein